MKVLTNAFWLSSCRILADLLSFALITVISRAFGPAGTGDYSYAFAVGTLVAMISTSGFEDYGIRQYARAAPSERPQLWRDILSAQCAQLALGALAFGLFALVGIIRASNVVVVLELSIYVVGWTISRTFFVPAMAAQSMVRPAFTDLACRVTAIVSALLLALFVRPSLPWTLAVLPLAGVTLAALALANAASRGAPLRPGRSLRRIVMTLRGTMPFAGSDVLNQFYARADLLLIAYFLGDANVGLYAIDIKFVEVGLLPLILLGTAAYPLLSTHAARDATTFGHAARDFMRLLFFLTGWLSIGILYLVPLIIVPLFGAKFAPAVPLLPWVALFALMKGGEATFYRLLYAARRQTLYCLTLLVGTILIVTLNFELIPAYGLVGALGAAIVSTAVIDTLAGSGLARQIGTGALLGCALRLIAAVAFTIGCCWGAQRLGLPEHTAQIAACAVYPLIGLLLGLVPHPRHSLLLRHIETSDAAPG
jgi:O-antigen/teichoic acid export membrane protein